MKKLVIKKCRNCAKLQKEIERLNQLLSAKPPVPDLGKEEPSAPVPGAITIDPQPEPVPAGFIYGEG